MSVAENQRALVAQQRALERRDPTAATQQVRYTAKDAPQVAEWDAENAIRQGLMANVIAYRCVQIIANTIAALPFRAGPDPEKPGTFNSKAPLALKLGSPPNGPAPKLSGRKLIAWSIAQKLVTGRFAWELELDHGQIVNLWPLPVAHLKQFPSDGGTQWFTKFQYGRADKPRNLTPDQVFYDWNPGALDFRDPESSFQSSRYDLSIAEMGDRYSYAFLKNGAVPAAVVITEAFPTVDQFERFKQNWRGEYQGPDNGGSVHFQEADADRPEGSKLSDAIYVQQLGVSQKDSQFIQQHKDALMDVAISLGVPWSKLDASGRTFDNALHEDTTFWESTILPIITALQDAINLDLAPRLGSELGWFDVSQVRALKPERKFPTFDVGFMLIQKIVSPNEFRDDLGLEQLPELEDWEPAAAVPDAVPAVPGEDATGTQEPAAAEEGNGTTGGEKGGRTGIPRETRQIDPEALETRRTMEWRRADAVVSTLEAQWEASMVRLFGRQERSVLQALGGKRGAKLLREPAPQVDPSLIFNKQYWIDQTSDHTTDLYTATAGAGGAKVAAQFGVSFNVKSAHAQDFINDRSNQLAGQVTDTTYRQIQKVLSDAVDSGASIEDITSEIRHIFEVASESRAATIARTEVVSAYNGASQLAASTLPADVVGGQEWISTRDGRTREDHADADGQAVEIGETFNVGGEDLAYPGDPSGSAENVVNCRCTIGFLTPAEMADTERSADLVSARVALAMVRPGDFDELSLRRALRSVA